MLSSLGFSVLAFQAPAAMEGPPILVQPPAPAASGLHTLLGVEPQVLGMIVWALIGMGAVLVLLALIGFFLLLGIKKQMKLQVELSDAMLKDLKQVAKWNEYCGHQLEQASEGVVLVHKLIEDRSSVSRKQSQAQAVQIGKLIHQQTEQITELLKQMIK